VRRRSAQYSRTPPQHHKSYESQCHTEWSRRYTKFNVVLWFHGCLFCKSRFSRWRVRRCFPSRITILAISAITAGIAQANSATSEKRFSRAIFDSDSFDILVDGGATSCISNNLADFITPPKNSTVKVKGFNGTTSSTKVGTVLWTILDDSGHRRTLKIRNTYYVPACPLRLLSPQHYTADKPRTYGAHTQLTLGITFFSFGIVVVIEPRCHCHQRLM
jgi:hypothetical protein